MEVTTSRWYENSVAVERGPLVYALAMRETWEKKPFGDGETAQFGDEYYEVTSADKWNYGILARAAEQPEKHFSVTLDRIATILYTRAPCAIG